MVTTLKNLPALFALNVLALVNAFTGGAFDHVFEAKSDSTYSIR